MLSVVELNAIMECRYAECCYAESHYAKCFSADCHYAERCAAT
jgi:hypothetical protein